MIDKSFAMEELKKLELIHLDYVDWFKKNKIFCGVRAAHAQISMGNLVFILRSQVEEAYETKHRKEQGGEND